jgi:HEAT repeat protein
MIRCDDNENRMVCDALSNVDIKVNSIYDLVNSNENYPEAIPILVDMLPKVKSDRIKEGVARALTVRNAGEVVAKALIKEFQNYKVSTESEEYTKWAIANAIFEVSDDSFYEDIVNLIKNKQYETGMIGGMLVKAVAKMKNPLKKEILLDLLTNDDLKGYVIIELGRLKYKEALPQIKNYLNCEEEWVRKEAIKAIKKIEGSK